MSKRSNWDGVGYSAKQITRTISRGGGAVRLCILCGRYARSNEGLTDIPSGIGRKFEIAGLGRAHYRCIKKLDGVPSYSLVAAIIRRNVFEIAGRALDRPRSRSLGGKTAQPRRPMLVPGSQQSAGAACERA